MSVTSGSFRPGRADVVLSVPALISRTAGYAIRMSGAVGGALSDGRPYPYMTITSCVLATWSKIFKACDLN